MVWRLLGGGGVPKMLSGSPQGQNYFYNNIKMLFILFTLILPDFSRAYLLVMWQQIECSNS